MVAGGTESSWRRLARNMEWLSASTTRVAFPGWEFGGATVITSLFCSHSGELSAHILVSDSVCSKDRARLHGVEEAMVLGEQRELNPARSPDLVEDMREVGLDRVLT